MIRADRTFSNRWKIAFASLAASLSSNPPSALAATDDLPTSPARAIVIGFVTNLEFELRADAGALALGDRLVLTARSRPPAPAEEKSIAGNPVVGYAIVTRLDPGRSTAYARLESYTSNGVPITGDDARVVDLTTVDRELPGRADLLVPDRRKISAS